MFITDQVIRLEEMLSDKIDPSCGAESIFIGRVRNHHLGKAVENLFYDCYQPMAEKIISQIADQAKMQWDISSFKILHRVGSLKIEDIAIVIVVHTAHRDEAFKACQWILEEIKAKVPIWKKETYADGSNEWVLPCRCSQTLV